MKKMRKLCSLLCTAVMLVLLVVPVHAEATHITISTFDDLVRLAKNCSYDQWSEDKVIDLQNDISLEGEDYEPIPVFAGIFNGNGYTISGTIKQKELSPSGIFANISSTGVVRDLVLAVTITDEGDSINVGGVAGINNGMIVSCRMLGSVSGSRNVGGIAGLNAACGTITGCSSEALVFGKKMTGGIAGYNLGVIDRCENNGYVNTESVDPELSLTALSLEPTLDIQNITNTKTNITITDTGGIAGYSDGVITRSNNVGTVGYPQIGYNTGGIVGRTDGYVGTCENEGVIYGRKDIGGIAGQAEPNIIINASAGDLEVLRNQLSSLDGMVSSASASAEGISSELSNSLESLSGYVHSASDAVGDLEHNASDAVDIISIPDYTDLELGNISVDLSNLNPDDLDVITIDDIDLDKINERGKEYRDALGSQIDAIKQIDMNAAGDALSASIAGMGAQAEALAHSLYDKNQQMVNQIRSISNQISAAESTFMGMLEYISNPDEIIQDTSIIDVYSVRLGKLDACINSGTVKGDLNVGGITGAMEMEYEEDPEDDLKGQVDLSSKRYYELKDIMLGCINRGSVTANRDDVGGIVGRMEIGLVQECESYGHISSASGSYVGGIAGITSSVVQKNYARCVLSGSDAIGGIVGAGADSDVFGAQSSVTNNVAMIQVEEINGSCGSIGGLDTGTYAGNLFVSDELGGINRASWQTRAEPVSYEELMERVDLPDDFQKFTLTFRADDEILKQVTFSYGDSFTENDMPKIPEKEGYYSYFDREDLSDLKFDTDVNAVYVPYQTSVASEDTRETGRPVFFLEGTFDEDARLLSKRTSGGGETLPCVKTDPSNAFMQYIKAFGAGLSYDIVEQWELDLPETEEDQHYVRYRVPKGVSGECRIYVREDNGWHEADSEMIGSYARFAIHTDHADVAAVSLIPGWWIYLGIIVLIAAVISAVLMFRTSQKREDVRLALKEKLKTHKRYQIITITLAVLFVSLFGAGIYFVNSGANAGLKAYQLINSYLAEENTVMSVDVSLSVDDETYETSLTVSQPAMDEADVTVITANDMSLYYAGNRIFLENGKGYNISPLVPDYSILLEHTASVIASSEITRTKADGITTYHIKAKQDSASALLKILMPDQADILPDVRAIELDVMEKDSVLYEVRFTSTGVLKDEEGSGYELHATLTPQQPQKTDVPSAVLTAIKKETPVTDTISREYLDLLYACAELNKRDPLEARIKVNTQGNILSVHDEMQVHRIGAEGKTITSVQKNDRVIYFTDDKICTADGITVKTAWAVNLAEIGRMPDLVYSIVLNGKFDVSNAEQNTLYTIRLDQDGMDKIVSTILDQDTRKLISLENGTIQITTTDRKIKRIYVSITGSAQIDEINIPVSVSLETVLSEAGTYTVPDKVLKALTGTE